MRVDIFNTDKKYQIIYADPPWKYNSRANHKTRFRGGACGHYELMKMTDIEWIKVNALVEDYRNKSIECLKAFLEK